MASIRQIEKYFFKNKSHFSEPNTYPLAVFNGEFHNDGFDQTCVSETCPKLYSETPVSKTRKLSAFRDGKENLFSADVSPEFESCTINGVLKKHFECTRRRTNEVLKDVFGCELKLVDDVEAATTNAPTQEELSTDRWERGTATNNSSTAPVASGAVSNLSPDSSSNTAAVAPSNFTVIIRKLSTESSRSKSNSSHFNDEEPVTEWSLRQQKLSTSSKDNIRATESQGDLLKAKEFVANNYHYGPFYENEFVFPDGSLIAYCLNGLIWKFGLDITLGSELKVFVRSASSVEDKNVGKQKYDKFRECMKTFHRMEKERVAVQQVVMKKGGAGHGNMWGGEKGTASFPGAFAVNDEHQFKFSDESCKHKLYNDILAKYNIPQRFYVPELRHIILDVSNIAETHGSQEPKKFSWLGVKIAYDHFRSCGHKQITLIVPHFKRHKTTDPEDLRIIRLFEDHDVIKYTQSRVPQASVHDDRMMLELAEKVGGVIVSNDKFSDVARDKAEWKRISRDFVCTFIFVKDVFILAPDPQGRQGDRLPRVLRKFEPNEYCCGTASLYCKFGEMCNYGKKCRYMHRTVKENKRVRSKRVPASGSSLSSSQASQPQTHQQMTEGGPNVLYQAYTREGQNPAIRVVHENQVFADQSAMQPGRMSSSLHPAMGPGNFYAVANNSMPRHFTSQHSLSSNESGDAYVLTSNQRTASLNSSYSSLSYGGSQHSDDSMSFQSNTTSSSFSMNHPTIYEQGGGDGEFSEIQSTVSSLDLYNQPFTAPAYYHSDGDPSNLSDTSSLTSTASSYFGAPGMNADEFRRNYDIHHGYYQQQQQAPTEGSQRRHATPVERDPSARRAAYDDYSAEIEVINERREAISGSNSGVPSVGHSGFTARSVESSDGKAVLQFAQNFNIKQNVPVYDMPQPKNAVIGGRNMIHAPENVGGQEGRICSHDRKMDVRQCNQKMSTNTNVLDIQTRARYGEEVQQSMNMQKKEPSVMSELESKKEVAQQMDTEDGKICQGTVDYAATNISQVALIYPIELCLLVNQSNPKLCVENKQVFCAKVAQLFCEKDTAQSNKVLKPSTDDKCSTVLSQLNETNTMIYHLIKLLPQTPINSILSSFPDIVYPRQSVAQPCHGPESSMISSTSGANVYHAMSENSASKSAKTARDHLRKLLFN